MGPIDAVSAALRDDPIVSGAIELLMACAPRGYIVGGLIRSVALGDRAPAHDIDVMYPNEFISDVDRLQSESLVRGLNRHGNLRFGYRGIHIDIFSPARFYGGFGTVESALCYFDVNINSMAISLDLQTLLDPLGAWSEASQRRCTLNFHRWEQTPPGMEQAVLRARLLSLFLRYETLVCTNPGVAMTDAEGLFQRFPKVVLHHTGLEPAKAFSLLRNYLDLGRSEGN